jgi:hypothetical protein
MLSVGVIATTRRISEADRKQSVIITLLFLLLNFVSFLFLSDRLFLLVENMQTVIPIVNHQQMLRPCGNIFRESSDRQTD